VKAKVGYLPDRPPLYEDLSVNDYLTFAARIRGVPSAQTAKLVAEAVELTELATSAKKIIGALSHGYKQRVGIAQAIVHAPELGRARRADFRPRPRANRGDARAGQEPEGRAHRRALQPLRRNQRDLRPHHGHQRRQDRVVWH